MQVRILRGAQGPLTVNREVWTILLKNIQSIEGAALITQRDRVFTIAGMDEIIMPLARLTVNYGIDLDGRAVVDVLWDKPHSDVVPDAILRHGIINHLENLEEQYAYGEDD